ncbi:Glyoxylase, beta-lactamase superfamily II [Singulisphaera sp. GP187]|uniref:MBL fold metallo-hydrolase n=1 Tax=Singulisphaera sp. GP187 TaxID=1882752 RepID=UPI00092B0557|nr:MBL fold metallo-hydrolase [Singulisphaera sp. GP187]SIO32779.1 Glyoxylase, beta-lactamase superfamily II [Singulisphaera sp. GP187]
MAATIIVPGLWEVSLGFVNAFVLESPDGLAVIDTGIAGSAGKILQAVKEMGREPTEVRHLLVTHCHSDHAGSVAELKRLTGASVTMHPADAALVRAGKALRPLKPTPGLINALVCRLMVASAPTEVEATEVEHEVDDGDILPIAGGLHVVHVPGHCAGQLAFLWPEQGGVLIAADAAANVFGLALSPLYEDLAEGQRSLAKLAALEFEAACFGHGKPIKRDAAARFRKKWRPNSAPVGQGQATTHAG